MPPSSTGDGEIGRKNRRGTRPPDYRSRSVQLQLLVLVAALMAVLVAMNEARKPETWTWLTGRQAGLQAEERIDSRLPLPDESSVLRGAPPATPPPGPLAFAPLEDEEEAVDYAWSEVYLRLGRAEKQDLARLLRTARRERGVTAADRAAWTKLVEKLDLIWSKFTPAQLPASAVENSELSETMSQGARQLAAEVERRWREHFRPPLIRAAGDPPHDATDRQVLLELQTILDRLDLAAVRDDTVWRPEEREAWFRVLERLQDSAPAHLAAESLGDTNFVQIFRQTSEYRGKVVTIHGTAWLGYRVQAPPNDLEIDNYVMLWLRPADGTEVPMVVYALDVPPGFPQLTITGQTPLREPVTVTGILFKRWVYRAHDGLNSVPLLVARSPDWIPLPPLPPSEWEQLQQRLGSGIWFVLGAVVVALAFFAAWLARGSSRSRITAAITHRDEATRDWSNLTESESVEQSLRRLAEREQNE